MLQRKSYSPPRATKFNLPLPKIEESSFSSDGDSNCEDSENISCQIPTIPSTSLPTLSTSGQIPRITPHCFVQLVSNEIPTNFRKIMVIDCRYNYEYDGGHIRGAINANTTELLFNLLFAQKNKERQVALIFHCEFSQNRGPELAGYVRDTDRKLNINRYPELFYPDLYIIDGGYSKFYEMYPEFCDGGYVKMRDKKHRRSGDLNKSTLTYKKSMQKSKKRLRSNDENVSSNENLVLEGKDLGLAARKKFENNTSTVQLLDF